MRHMYNMSWLESYEIGQVTLQSKETEHLANLLSYEVYHKVSENYICIQFWIYFLKGQHNARIMQTITQNQPSRQSINLSTLWPKGENMKKSPT